MTMEVASVYLICLYMIIVLVLIFMICPAFIYSATDSLIRNVMISFFRLIINDTHRNEKKRNWGRNRLSFNFPRFSCLFLSFFLHLLAWSFSFCRHCSYIESRWGNEERDERMKFSRKKQQREKKDKKKRMNKNSIFLSAA